MSKTKASDPASPADGPAPRLNPQIHEFVARSLKAHYESIVQAPIPDKFLVLLAKLEIEERKVAAEEDNNERR